MEAAQVEKKQTKKRKQVSEDKPKKLRGVSSAWVMFSNQEREKIFAERPELKEKLKFGQQAAMLSQRWNALSDEQKKPYFELYAKDKERYEQEKKAYVEATGEKPHKRRHKREPGKPKHATSAYMQFVSARRAGVLAAEPTLTFETIGKRLGELWKALTAEEKRPFEELAAKDKLRYETEMKAWKESRPAEN